MIEKKIKRTAQIFSLVSILFLIQMLSIEQSMVGNVSAGSSWIQTTEADFNAGTLDNVTVTASGDVKLILEPQSVVDEFTSHSKIGSSDSVILDITPGYFIINKSYGGSGTEYARCVQQTSDGGYIIAGSTGSYGGPLYEVWLVKTDFMGNEEWNKTFGGSSSEYGFSVQQTSDGGYIIAGYTFSYGAGSYDVWLIKTDNSGNEEWNETYGGSQGDYGYSVQETSDGGFIIAGTTYSYGPGDMDMWLIKTNYLGVEEWNNTFGSSTEEDEGYSAIEAPDGGFIITGIMTPPIIGGSTAAWLIKTNSTGDEKWNKTFGGTSNDNAKSVRLTSDGGLILVGSTASFGAGKNDVWLIKTDIDGNEIWNRTYGGEAIDNGYSVQETSDGGLFVAGSTNSFGDGKSDLWVIKTENYGNEIWNRSLGGNNDDAGYWAQQTSDGGFIITGIINSWGSSGQDAWLVKLDKSVGMTKLVKINRTYGGSLADYGWSVLETSDGGFIVTGYTQNYGAGNYDAWLIKTGKYGYEKWNKTFGGVESDGAYAFNKTFDGGFIITGYTRSWGAEDSNAWLIKTDKYGNEQWNKTYGGPGRDIGRSVRQTSDGGYIICGQTTSWGAEGTNAWLIKTSDIGKEEWNFTYGGSKGDYGYSVVVANDYGYVIAGITESFGINPSVDNAWLIKTYANGKEHWNRTYGGVDDDRAYCVDKTSDGGYVITGETWSWGAGNYDVWLIKTDSTGVIKVNKTFGGSSTDSAKSVVETSDKGYAIFGESWSFANGGYDFWLIKTDSSGGIILNKTFGGSTNEQGYSIQQTTDGGYVIFGYTRSYGAGNADFWLIKTDSAGSMVFTQGEFTSKNLLAGKASYSITNFSCEISIPSGTNARVQFSKNSISWYDSGGIPGQWDVLSDGINLIDLLSLDWNGSYFYYRVEFASTSDLFPILHNITLSYIQYIAMGTFISQPFDSGGPVSWDTLDWNAQTPPDTDIIFQLRSATTLAGLFGKNFVGPGGLPITYYTSPGSVIWPGHNNERWIQFKAYFRTTSGNVTPILNDVTISYNRLPDPPDLSLPTNFQITNDSTPQFEWHFQDTDGTQTGFQVLIDDDNNFGSVNYDSGMNTSSNENWQFPLGTGYAEITDGIWYWQVRTRDNDGDWSPYSINWSFTLDTTILPPEDIYANPGSWTGINSFSVHWTNPSDLTGIAGAYYKLDSAPTSNTDGTYEIGSGITSISDISVSGDGPHTIYVWLKDDANNINFTNYNTTVFYYDGSAPSSPTDVKANPNDWTATDLFTVTWTNPSELSGIAGAYYKLDSPPTHETDGTYVAGSDITSINGITVSDDGAHTIYIWLEDEVGNIDHTNYGTTILYLDATPPTSPTDVTAIPSSWTNTNSYTVQWTNPADTSGIAGVYYKLYSQPTWNGDGTYVPGPGINSISSISVSGEGQHSIYIWLVDGAGNVDYAYNGSTFLHLDTTPPDSPMDLIPTPNTWTSINSFSVSWVNPSDLSGIGGAYYKLDFAPSHDTDGTLISGPGLNSISGITVGSDGGHTIYIWLNDNASNADHTTYNTTTLYYDGTAPNSPSGLTATPDTWTATNSFMISWFNPAELSGIAGAYYKLDSAPTSDTDGTYVADPDITNINGITVTGDAQHPIYVWLQDNAGNADFTTSDMTFLYYDGTAPSLPLDLTATPSTWTSTNSFSVAWTNPTEVSGIAGAYYKLDTPPTSDTDGIYVAGSDITSISSIAVSGDGAHTIYIWLTDEAGNVDHNNFNTTILYYDGGAPSLPMDVTADPDIWTSINLFNVSWINPSDITGIAGAYYKLDSLPTHDTDGTYVAGSGINNITDITVSGDGAHTIYIWLEDGLGNIDFNNYNTTILYYDGPAPSEPLNITAIPDTWTSINLFDVFWDNPFEPSGIAGAYYKLDSPPTSNTDGTYVAGSDIISITGITVSGDGAHTIYVWLKNGAGNVDYNNTNTTIFYFDSTPPSQPTGITADPISWTSLNSFLVSWTNPSDDSGIAGAYYKLDTPPTSNTDGTYVAGPGITSISNIMVSGDGQHTIYIWLVDNASNVDYINNGTTFLYYDSTAPSLPTGVGATPSTWTATNSFTVTWTNPSDLSGIGGVYYKLDTAPTSDTDGTLVTGPGINSITNIVVSSDGAHTIYIWLLDNASNVDHNNYATTILYYDGAPPSSPTNVVANPSIWTATNLFSVSWTNPTELSGIAGAYYKLDSLPTSDTDGTYVAGSDITSISNIVVTGDGQHPIYIWLIDELGNIDYNNYGETNLNLDSTAPSSPTGVAATPSSWTAINSFDVSWTNPSDLSGIAGAYYKLDSAPTSDTDGTLVSGSGINSFNNIPVSGDGQHTIYIWLIDEVGNIDYNNRDTTILYYDGSAPSKPTDITADPVSWTSTNSFTVTWTNPSDLSGIAGAYYKLDSQPTSNTDGTLVSGSGITSISSIVVTGDGQHSIYVWLIDEVGNINYINRNSTVLYYDGSAPSSPTNVMADPNTWTSTDLFTISWDNPPELSGIDGAYYKLDSVPSTSTDGTLVSGSGITSISNIAVLDDGQHTIYIWLIDKAGNINHLNRGSTVLQYDATAPSLPQTVEANPSSWTSTNSFTVSWINPSELSGIAGAYYKLDSEPTSNTDGTYVAENDITSISSITVSGDGEHTIYIWLKDKAGNVDYNNNASTILYYDGSAPSKPEGIAANPDNWTAVNSFSVSWTNPTDLSGIVGAYYKLDTPPSFNTDGTYAPGAGISSLSNIFVSGDGQHTIYVWLKDGVDNINYNNHNTTILYYDGSAPSVPTGISVNPNTWTSVNSFTINWNNPSDVSGIKEGAYYYIGTSPPTSSADGSWTSDKPFTITNAPQGSNNIYLWLEDNVGNKNHLNYGSIVLKLDNTPATIQHTFVTAGTINEPITIEAEVIDTHTGVNSVLLYWKKKSDDIYISEIMDGTGDTYSAEITTDSTESLEYYIKATDQSQPPNIGYYSLYGQVTDEPDSSNDIDITISGVDKIPPTVSTISPSDTSTNVPVGTKITITFSEPMNKTSVQSAFSIKDSGGNSKTGDFSWSGNTMTFTPDGKLYPETQYTVRLGTTAMDLAGNPLSSESTVQFTTGADSTQPTIVETSPGGSDVSIAEIITIRFSKTMDETATENAFSISPQVSGKFEWEGNTLKFIPDDLLVRGRVYTVTMDSSAKDLDGNNVLGYSWQFTTKSSEDVSLPSIKTKSPDGSGVPVDTEITIVFSVEMDEKTTEKAFSIEPSVEGVFTWKYVTLTFIPSEPLDYETMYTVRINSSAKGIDGRYLDEEEDWSFITEKKPEKTEAGLFSWENLEPIVTGVTILVTFLLALFGFLQIRKKRNKLRQYLEQIDDTFNEYKKNYQTCEQELITLRDNIKREVKEGRLEENHFLILDKKIDDYLLEMKTLDKGSPSDINKMHPFEEFVEEETVDIKEE
ncbi:MAG: Ig-like domain-containing protein [Thermoplasmata archaeon]|nr:MAG: Ig-like domain-containing protein [Thermoplasmata archaeon]